MTEILLLLFLCLVLLFAGIVFYGAPYVPTKKQQVEAALDLLDLRPGQVLLELGAGDGRVAIAAARRGISVVGYELNPILVVIAKLRTYAYREQVTIKWRNYLHATWPPVDGIFLFGADLYMKGIRKKIMQSAGNAKVASFAFQFKHDTPIREEQGVFLYDYRLAKESIQR